MKAQLIAVFERTRTDLLEVVAAVESDDPERALRLLNDIVDRIRSARRELRS